MSRLFLNLKTFNVMSDLQTMYQKKGEIIHWMKETLAGQEGRALSAEQKEKWDKQEADLNDVQDLIDRQEKVRSLLDGHETAMAGLAPEVAETRSQVATQTVKPEQRADRPKVTYRSAFENWVTNGPSGMTSEEVRALQTGEQKGKPLTAAAVKALEQRGTDTQISSTPGLGGYLSPEDWANEVVESMKAYGGMLEAGQIFRTKGGDVFHIPTEDTTTQMGAIIGQGVADTVADVTWGEKTMGAFTYTSRIIKIGQELWAEDDAFNVLSRVQGIASRRVGRKLNLDLTTGAGTTLPFGVVTEATTSGISAASATAVSRAELLQLIHSVDPAYRVGPKVGFMFNDSTLSAIRQLSIGSADDRPLWVPSMRDGAPDTIEGERYWINQDMASMASENKSILYGDFSKYWIRQVRGMVLSRSDQRYWEERVVAYFLTARFDGKLVDTAAIKYFQNAS